MITKVKKIPGSKRKGRWEMRRLSLRFPTDSKDLQG